MPAAATARLLEAADPLNVVGIVTLGERVPALSGNRVLFEQRVSVAVHAGGKMRPLEDMPAKLQREIRDLLIRCQRSPAQIDIAWVG